MECLMVDLEARSGVKGLGTEFFAGHEFRLHDLIFITIYSVLFYLRDDPAILWRAGNGDCGRVG